MKTSIAILLGALCLLHPNAKLPQEAQRNAPSEGKPSIPTVDINRATAGEFAKLPGIGPGLAQRIVAYREKHGPFRRVEDLLVIKGIGRKKWKSIRPYLKIGKAAGRAQEGPPAKD